jgi:pimeloyl-ACP methyl ester carboxylesterase
MRRKVVIGIHGMGNKPPEGVLKNWWLASFYEGLRTHGYRKHSFRFELVYWAHHLHPFSYDPKLLDEYDPLYLHEPYVPSTGKSAPKPSSFRRKSLGIIEKILDKLLLNEDMTINYKSITDSIIRKHFKDLEFYYSSGCVGEKYKGCLARDIIGNDLREVLRKFKDYDIMLVAHSMGTIISYDILSEKGSDRQVDTFVTMGSPLGLPVIISRFAQKQKALDPKVNTVSTPQNVLRRWYNLSDLEDRVAFNYDLGDDYAPNAIGVVAEDLIVHNDYEVDGKANHHKVYGYLRTQEMAEILDEFLTDDSVLPKPSMADRLRRIWVGFKGRLRRAGPVHDPV